MSQPAIAILGVMSVGSIINNKNNENNSINNTFRIVANAFDINSKT